jgi:uncharacterized protein (TIGR02246 family)
MITIDSTAQVRILAGVLDAWANGIREHRPHVVASYFTEKALFQGFDKRQTIGKPGIVAYYDKQPAGLSPTYRIQEHRQLSDDALISYLDVDFTLPDGEVIPVHLTALLQLVAGSWLISHYHVSKIQ